MAATPVGEAGGPPRARDGHTAEGSRPDGRRAWPEAGTVAVLAAVALGVRWIVWQRTAAMMNDGPAFLALAQDVAAGRWGDLLAHPYHPLYPLAIALAHPLLGSWEAAGVAVSIASGVAAVGALYAFLRAAFGPPTAAVGALLLAVHPYAAPFSADVQSEGLYMATFLAAVALTWRALQAPGWGLALAAGACSGLAYLTRPEGLGVVLVGGAALAGLWLRGRRTWRQTVVSGAGLALGAALFVAPYTAAVAHETGEVRLTRKKSVAAIASLEGGRRARPAEAAPAPGAPAQEGVAVPAEPAREGGRAGREGQWRGDPPFVMRVLPRPAAVRAALGEVAGQAKRAFRLDHFVIAVLGAVAAGGPLGLRGAFLGGLALLYGFVLVGLHMSVGYVSMRHALPPLLPLLGYVALGVPSLGRIVLFVPRRLARRGPPSPRAALLVGLAILVTASTVMAVRPQREERAATRRAAEWLAAQPLAVDRVASAKSRDAWYADAEPADLPEPRGDAGGDWVEALRREGVRWAIVDEKPSKRYPGLGTGPADPRIRVLHREEAGGRVAWVVEILEPE